MLPDRKEENPARRSDEGNVRNVKSMINDRDIDGGRGRLSSSSV